MKAKTFDSKFDSGEKIVNQLDLRKARRIGTDAKRVNVDFPAWMVDSLDREARRTQPHQARSSARELPFARSNGRWKNGNSCRVD